MVGGIRVVLGPRYSNLNSLVVQTAHANDYKHILQLDGVFYGITLGIQSSASLRNFQELRRSPPDLWE